MKHITIFIVTILLLVLVSSGPLLAVVRGDSGDIIATPINATEGPTSSGASNQSAASCGSSAQNYANLTLGGSGDSPLVNVYYYSVNLTQESKLWLYYFVNFTFVSVGTYTLENIISLTNPSDRWRNWVSGAELNGSTSYLNVSATEGSWYPYAVLVDRQQTLTNVYQINITVQITSVPATNFFVSLIGHSVITDVNGDGKVDIKDVNLVARYVTTPYTDGSLNVYDLNMDQVIDLIDVSLVALDYGFTVPPT